MPEYGKEYNSTAGHPEGDVGPFEMDEATRAVLTKRLAELQEEVKAAQAAQAQQGPNVSVDTTTLTFLVQELSDEFDTVCQERHLKGQEKYGVGKFLEVDSIEMMLEEIADAANYARYTFIKLRLIQEGARKLLPQDVDGTTDKGPTFKKVGEEWGKE
jgi:hypothetical protein